MNIWALSWGIIVLFSIISFSYISFEILYKSIAELKEMFKTLDDRYKVSRLRREHVNELLM